VGVLPGTFGAAVRLRSIAIADTSSVVSSADQLAELQREAPDLAGRRMRYPGSASRAVFEAGPVPARSITQRSACGWHEPKAGHRLTDRPRARNRPDQLSGRNDQAGYRCPVHLSGGAGSGFCGPPSPDRPLAPAPGLVPPAEQRQLVAKMAMS
jgi:hypothetical protein